MTFSPRSAAPSLRIVDLTARLGAQAIGQVGGLVAVSETRSLVRLTANSAPAVEWVRAPDANADLGKAGGPRAVILLAGPGSVRSAEDVLSRTLAAGTECVRIFVMPSAIVEELRLKPFVADAPAVAHLHRLPDSSPETLWFVLLEEFTQLASRHDIVSIPPFQTTQEEQMSTLKQSMDAIMTIDGATATALVDFRSGMCLAQAGGGMNLELAAAGNSQVVRAKLQTMESLGLRRGIEDILISLGDQYHLIRLVPNNPGLFLYLVLDRAKGNLALARYKLAEVERTLRV